MNDTKQNPAALPGAARWRKRPVAVDAALWDGTATGATTVIDWILANGGTARYHDDPPALSIDTLEGTMLALPGSWVIRGVAGEFYRCAPDIFERTYEPAANGAGAQEPRSALEAAVRDRVSRNCRHPAKDCPFCDREAGEFMKLADAYAESSAEVSADELGALKSDITDLVGELRVSAGATRPSRESQVEDMVAAALTKLLEDS